MAECKEVQQNYAENGLAEFPQQFGNDPDNDGGNVGITEFRINGSTIYLQLNGGRGGCQTGPCPAGDGGSAVVGSGGQNGGGGGSDCGSNGGQGGNGGVGALTIT